MSYRQDKAIDEWVAREREKAQDAVAAAEESARVALDAAEMWRQRALQAEAREAQGAAEMWRQRALTAEAKEAVATPAKLLHRAEAAEDRVWELERGVAEIARIAGSLMEGVEESDG